jgi:hypothetical protein
LCDTHGAFAGLDVAVVAVVELEDLPERGLDLVAVLSRDLGQDVTRAVDETTLPQCPDMWVSMAPIRPAAPSEMTNNGTRRPRARRSSRKPAQA